MKLNIYKISHPILQTLIDNLNKREQSYKHIGFLFIYEIFRKYIEIEKIYIKQVRNIKLIHVINKNKKYFILTNISHTYDMINDIITILPEVHIINVNYQSTNKIEESLKNLRIDVDISKILIIEKITNKDQTIDLIKYLEKKKNLHSKNINIGCIISNEETLNKIGNNYPALKVYTTKIIYKNK
uniref:hypothetical protein orf184 n=1 Tax=Amplisiphonia pacifica TaxID=1563190 RepID=UPI0022FD56C7|nr:hypothetical protein orf184 [Amplisiphonia pacifica]WAX03384.1 hypothetical protein orf184 [Amplisiphonia pacifica]